MGPVPPPHSGRRGLVRGKACNTSDETGRPVVYERHVADIYAGKVLNTVALKSSKCDNLASVFEIMNITAVQ